MLASSFAHPVGHEHPRHTIVLRALPDQTQLEVYSRVSPPPEQIGRRYRSAIQLSIQGKPVELPSPTVQQSTGPIQTTFTLDALPEGESNVSWSLNFGGELPAYYQFRMYAGPNDEILSGCPSSLFVLSDLGIQGTTTIRRDGLMERWRSWQERRAVSRPCQSATSPSWQSLLVGKRWHPFVGLLLTVLCVPIFYVTQINSNHRIAGLCIAIFGTLTPSPLWLIPGVLILHGPWRMIGAICMVNALPTGGLSLLILPALWLYREVEHNFRLVSWFSFGLAIMCLLLQLIS